jgi:hypothetical protein
MNDLLIVITTCEHYLLHNNNVRLYKILRKLFKNVIIVSGQENKNKSIFLEGIPMYKVKYTGLHHTGAIYINENYNDFSKFKYFLFLPDTIYIGYNFKNNLLKYYNNYLKDKDIQLLGLINPSIRPTMDMGIFNIEHIRNSSEYLSKIKTFDCSKNNLLQLKKMLIFDEDTIFGNPNTDKGFNYKITIKDNSMFFICNDKQDIFEKQIQVNTMLIYISPLDLYKVKRNFRGPYANLLIDYNQ